MKGDLRCIEGRLELVDLWRDMRGIEPPIQLFTRDYVDWPRLAWAYRLSPLGLAVRQVLQQEQEK